MKRFFLFSAVMLSLFAGIGSALAIDPDAEVQARQEVLKGMGKEMKALGAISKGDIDSERTMLVDSAKHMREFSSQPWAYFGQETAVTRLDNKAKSTIWSDPNGFHTAQQNFMKAADDLSLAAATGKPEDIRAKIDTLGAACGACHKVYRNN